MLDLFTLDQLSQASTFGALFDESTIWLIKNGRGYHLDKDDILFSAGESGNSFFVILQGSIAHYKQHEGRYAFIRNYEQGQQIGFMSLIGLHDRVGKALANEETVVLEIDSSLFHNFHEESPMEFGILLINLSRELARTLRSVDNKIVTQSYTGK